MNQNKQHEALRLADQIESRFCTDEDATIAEELRRLHARVQELEASHAQRVPLSDAQIEQAMEWCDVCEGDHVLGAFSAGVRHVEKLYGITQEKQG